MKLLWRTEKSLKSATDKKIIIGKFGATHGVRGDIKVYPLTDFPERFNTIKNAYVDDKEIEITSTRYQKNFVVMKIKNINNREEAMRLTNKLLKINRADIAPLDEGEYYVFDIVGLNVINQDDIIFGKVIDILKTGSNDVYVVQSETDKQILIPALKKVVTEINIEAGYIKVVWNENQEV